MWEIFVLFHAILHKHSFTLMQYNAISVHSCILPQSINCSSMQFPGQHYAILVFSGILSNIMLFSCFMQFTTQYYTAIVFSCSLPFFSSCWIDIQGIHSKLQSIQTEKYLKFTVSIKKKKKKKGKEKYDHFTQNTIPSPTESCTIPRKHSWKHTITSIQKNMKKKFPYSEMWS